MLSQMNILSNGYNPQKPSSIFSKKLASLRVIVVALTWFFSGCNPIDMKSMPSNNDDLNKKHPPVFSFTQQNDSFLHEEKTLWQFLYIPTEKPSRMLYRRDCLKEELYNTEQQKPCTQDFEEYMEAIQQERDFIMNQQFAIDMFGEEVFENLRSNLEFSLYKEHFIQLMVQKPDFSWWNQDDETYLENEIYELYPWMSESDFLDMFAEVKYSRQFLENVEDIESITLPYMISKNGAIFQHDIFEGLWIIWNRDTISYIFSSSENLYYLNGKIAFDKAMNKIYYPNGSILMDGMWEYYYWPNGKIAIEYTTGRKFDKSWANVGNIYDTTTVRDEYWDYENLQINE